MLPDLHRERGLFTRQELIAIGDWVRDTCIAFGTEIQTAYKCAAAMVQGLEPPPPAAQGKE